MTSELTLLVCTAVIVTLAMVLALVSLPLRQKEARRQIKKKPPPM
jgi:hypothetical protein